MNVKLTLRAFRDRNKCQCEFRYPQVSKIVYEFGDYKMNIERYVYIYKFNTYVLSIL